MIEKVYGFHTQESTKVEMIVNDSHVRINHLVLTAGDQADPHPTPDDAHMIVTRGVLSIALGDQEPHNYEEGNIIKIPAGTMMHIKNGGDETLHVFVIKAQ
ncbi:MAG: cupin domain-containing protein [Sphaerochaetaceae bacterium]|nr:cupin domain-containing protein [Sphaerochaetaceae bacterium]MDC7247043.1 cupin domain-containing protein [Sphaerochaetaceae bacterium]